MMMMEHRERKCQTPDGMVACTPSLASHQRMATSLGAGKLLGVGCGWTSSWRHIELNVVAADENMDSALEWLVPMSSQDSGNYCT